MKPDAQHRYTLWAWRLLLLVLLGLVMRLALAPAPQPPQPDWFENADKLRHASAFALFWWVGMRALPRAGWPLALGLLAYGLSIELAQTLLTTDREASVGDVLADACGLALGWALLRWLGQVRLGALLGQLASHMKTAGNLSGN
jgi:VanZ family protein